MQQAVGRWRTLQGHRSDLTSIVFLSDGGTIVSGSADNTIRYWGRCQWERVSDAPERFFFSRGRVFGRRFAGRADDRLWGRRLYNQALGCGDRAGDVCAPGHSSTVTSVAFSPDGRTIASGSADRTIKLWDVSALVAAPLTGPTDKPVLPCVVARAPPATTASAATPPEPKPAALANPSSRRVALIIANGAYHDAPLSNPIVDAAIVEDSLKKIGFAVTVKKDLDLDAFEQAIDDFAETAKGADVALFYFAGHGFSVASGGVQQNLLMATSANFSAKTAQALLGGGEPLETCRGDDHPSRAGDADLRRRVPQYSCSRRPRYGFSRFRTVRHRFV